MISPESRRAIHFLRETARVQEQVHALEAGDSATFLAGVIASGRSSALWLQNCYAVSMPAEQGIMLALALTEQYPGVAQRGAWRVHGGGFAGTMLGNCLWPRERRRSDGPPPRRSVLQTKQRHLTDRSFTSFEVLHEDLPCWYRCSAGDGGIDDGMFTFYGEDHEQ